MSATPPLRPLFLILSSLSALLLFCSFGLWIKNQQLQSELSTQAQLLELTTSQRDLIKATLDSERILSAHQTRLLMEWQSFWKDHPAEIRLLSVNAAPDSVALWNPHAHTGYFFFANPDQATGHLEIRAHDSQVVLAEIDLTTAGERPFIKLPALEGITVLPDFRYVP